jgi:hypothetical protein
MCLAAWPDDDHIESAGDSTSRVLVGSAFLIVRNDETKKVEGMI